MQGTGGVGGEFWAEKGQDRVALWQDVLGTCGAGSGHPHGATQDLSLSFGVSPLPRQQEGAAGPSGCSRLPKSPK